MKYSHQNEVIYEEVKLKDKEETGRETSNVAYDIIVKYTA